MKLQWSPSGLRLRLDEDEFAGLIAGRGASLQLTALGWQCGLEIGTDWTLAMCEGRLAITLPRSECEALAARLPSRDGLAADVEIAGAGRVALALEVDVRDSRRRRGRNREGG
jgi:hypothetical protein